MTRTPRFLHPLATRMVEHHQHDGVPFVEVADALDVADTPFSRAMTEAHLQATTHDLLLLHGWRFHHETDSRRSWSGLPDVIAVRGTELIALELKSPSGVLTPAQDAWLADWSDAHGAGAAIVGTGDVHALNLVLRQRLPLPIPPYVQRYEERVAMPEVMASTRQRAARRRCQH